MKVSLKLGGQDGFALIMAIIVLVVSSLLVTVLTSAFTSHTAGNVETVTSMRAFYIAEGGLEAGIKSYRANCSGYGGETNGLGGGTFTTQIFATDFSGSSLPAGQIRLRSTGAIGQATRIVEQIVSCNQLPIIGEGGITIGSLASIDCGGGVTCTQAAINGGTCPCAKQNTPLSSAPSVPTPTPGAPPGGCPTGGTMLHYTWPAGTYYCSSITIGTQSDVTVTGPVTVFSGAITVGTQGRVNANGQPSNLLVIASNSMNIGSQGVFTGAVYAPGQALILGSESRVYGTIDGNTIIVGSIASIQYDSTAGTNSPRYDDLYGNATTQWREVLQ